MTLQIRSLIVFWLCRPLAGDTAAGVMAMSWDVPTDVSPPGCPGKILLGRLAFALSAEFLQGEQVLRFEA